MFKDGKDYDVKLPKVAWNKGFDHLDPETRARVNKFLGVGGGAKPGHIVSDETKRKISVANKGRVLGSPSRETLLKITKNLLKIILSMWVKILLMKHDPYIMIRKRNLKEYMEMPPKKTLMN